MPIPRGLIDVLNKLAGISAGEDPGSDRDSRRRVRTVDVTTAAIPLIKEALYEGLIHHAAADVATKQIAEMELDCQEHAQMQERLQMALQEAQQSAGIDSQKAARLDSLLNEIVDAMCSGRTLTGSEVRTGRRNALNVARYFDQIYLPKPRTAETAAEDGSKVNGKGTAPVGDFMASPPPAAAEQQTAS